MLGEPPELLGRPSPIDGVAATVTNTSHHGRNRT